MVNPLLSLAQSIGAIGDLIHDKFQQLINFISPYSETNFLKVLFVPSPGFFQGEIAENQAFLNSRFGWVSDIYDIWFDIRDSYVEGQAWQGIKINHPLVGEQYIVSPIAINEWSSKIKSWIGGFIVVITLLVSIKKAGDMLR